MCCKRRFNISSITPDGVQTTNPGVAEQQLGNAGRAMKRANRDRL
jgi:hypothetical protein